MIRRALLSVSDKTGLAELGRALSALGFELLSTGGTEQALRSAGVGARSIADFTGSPEILGGRVKTLHPKVHGGLLGRRDVESDLAEMKAQAIEPIELVVVNLYPFRQTVARGAPHDEVIEQIDIGGPSMVRSAAKNARFVGVVVDPADYREVLAELTATGGLSEGLRTRLQAKAFAHTASYDASIASYLTARSGEIFPAERIVVATRVANLRYGENPHQRAALYRLPTAGGEPEIAAAAILQGKELSYNNLLDLDSALACLKEFEPTAAVIVKHNTPCGVSLGPSLEAAYRAARACDETSAFGGIVALNREVDGQAARALAETFLECVVAPGFSPEAREVLGPKKNLRLLELPGLQTPSARKAGQVVEVRSIGGGLLVQDRDVGTTAEERVVTHREPTPEQLRDLRFAMRVVKHVRSNAIVFAQGGTTTAIGGGQTSRVEAVKLAAMKAAKPLVGSVVASDAFFPFRDGLDACAHAGAVACIQPGGSVRDAEVIKAADEHAMAMVLTGMRHFRH